MVVWHVLASMRMSWAISCLIIFVARAGWARSLMDAPSCFGFESIGTQE
jgi:hypothetical protein